MIRIAAALGLLLLFSGCGDGDGGGSSTPPAGPAQYRVTFTATWSAETHPNLYPAGAHFSGLAGANHAEDVFLFRTGELATTGIKNVAETGDRGVLLGEVNGLIQQGQACSTITGSGTPSPGSVSATFSTSPSCTEATVVTMLAPSPDWFTAANGVSLVRNGDWVDEVTVPATVYDAGTDSGEDFTSPDQPTVPAEPIMPLNQFGSIGSFTFTRIQ